MFNSRISQNSAASPTASNNTDSPIEVGGPLSLTSRAPTTGISTPNFASHHIFGSFSER